MTEGLTGNNDHAERVAGTLREIERNIRNLDKNKQDLIVAHERYLKGVPAIRQQFTDKLQAATSDDERKSIHADLATWEQDNDAYTEATTADITRIDEELQTKRTEYERLLGI